MNQKVNVHALRHALLFMELLPKDLLPTSLNTESDGDTCMEWYGNPNWVVSISVNEQGLMSWAALFDDQPMKGSEYFEPGGNINVREVLEMFCQGLQQK